MSSGDLPYGSELAWAGAVAPDAGVKFSQDTSSEFAFSYDFPNYMSNWYVTGITNQNIQFTRAEYEKLNTMQGLNDPTNPALQRFAGRGGKLLMWQGWADQGSTVEATLNYYAAVREYVGANNAAGFLALYMIPGVYHCNVFGPRASTEDFLTPLIAWVENGTRPGKVVASYHTDASESSPVIRTRAIFPYPATSVYTGQGDVFAGTADAGCE